MNQPSIFQSASGILLLLATTFTLVSIGLAVRVWWHNRTYRAKTEFIHMSSMLLLLFVCIGSWGSYLAVNGFISRELGGFLGAIGRGSLLTLSIYFLLLYRQHDGRRQMWAPPPEGPPDGPDVGGTR